MTRDQIFAMIAVTWSVTLSSISYLLFSGGLIHGVPL